MGLTLSRARKGTSAANGGSKLAYNSVNEDLLIKIMDWVQSYASAHPTESKMKFKSAMSWHTSLKIEDFSGGAFEQRYAHSQCDTVLNVAYKRKGGLLHDYHAHEHSLHFY